MLGGLYSGWIFLANWKVLSTRQAGQQVQVQGPGGVVLTIPEPPALRPGLPSLPGATAEHGQSEQPSTQPLIPLPDWTGKERINVLLMGIDHREDEPLQGSRADTLLVVSVDPVSKSVLMVSLPRDLWVSIPGLGEQRINVAHATGGPELAMRTVTANFGVKLNHYARIDFRGFEEIVDTLGGIFVDVERPIKDDEYPTEDYGVMRIFIAPGPQWMDGRTALQYARSRHSENDFGRARRQQRVLMAIRDRAAQGNTLLKAWELIPLAQKTVTTDFGPLELAQLAKLATEIDRERVQTLVIDVDYARPFTTYDGAQVLLPNKAAIQSAISQALARSAAQPTPVPRPSPQPDQAPAAAVATPQALAARVEVLNGTNRQGLARATADWLVKQGVEVIRVDSAERADYAETRLLAPPGQEAAAALLARKLDLPDSAVELLSGDQSSADLRLVLGGNYQIPAP